MKEIDDQISSQINKINNKIEIISSKLAEHQKRTEEALTTIENSQKEISESLEPDKPTPQ